MNNHPLCIDNASRAAVALQAGLPLPNDVRLWLLGGLQAYLNNGDDLSRALCLVSLPGGHFSQPHVVAKLVARDNTIKSLASLVCPDLSAWQAAGKLDGLMRAHGAGEPINLPDEHPALYLLKRLKGSPLLSRKQLCRILSGNRSS